MSRANATDFELLVVKNFSFLATQFGMVFSGSKVVGKGDPREAGFVANYRMRELKVDVGWSEAQMSVSILIHLTREDVPRGARYLYLDSFVEFASDGLEGCTVAQIYPKMSDAGIVRAMEERRDLLARLSLSEVLALLAEKLRLHFRDIANVSSTDILRYHEWIGTRR